MSITSRLRGGKKEPAKKTRKAPVKRAGKAPARKVATKTRVRSKASMLHRREYQRNFMREYRAKLHQRGIYLDKHGHAHKMTAEQKARWAKRRSKHGKNWNKKQSTGQISKEKRGKIKSRLERAKKSRHGRRLSGSVSVKHTGTSLKGKVKTTTKAAGRPRYQPS